jgi:hypothetical protein
MINTLRNLAKDPNRPNSVSETIRIHDMAVDNVERPAESPDSSYRNFEKGLCLDCKYSLEKYPTFEAKRDFFRYNFMMIDGAVNMPLFIDPEFINHNHLATLRDRSVSTNFSINRFSQQPTQEEILQLSKDILQPYFNMYEKLVSNSEDDYQKLRAITILLRAITILHMFPDGNLRTVILLLNKLLAQCNFPPVILDNPKIFGGYLGTSEMVDEIKKGMYNYMKISYIPIS